MRVEWKESALARLADVFVQASLHEQDALEQSALSINRNLARDPHDLGESRETVNDRVWFADLLVVGFRIDPAGNLVVVYHTASFRRSR